MKALPANRQGSHADGYRRGDVLGLTMAEAIILVIFIMILVATSTSLRKDSEREEALATAGIQARLSSTLRSALEKMTAERDLLLKRVGVLEGDMADFKNRSESLERRYSAANEEIKKLKLELEAMSKAAGGSARDIDASQLRVKELETRIFYLERENAYLREQLKPKTGVGGVGLPHCWSSGAGDPIFLLRVAMFDGDLVSVQERARRERPSDDVWRILASVPREQKMTIESLRTAFAGLLDDAKSKRCKYAIEAVDQTGGSNKGGYKRLRGALNDMFFVRETR